MNMRMKRRLTVSLAVLFGTFAGVAASAQESPARVEGEVVQLMQQTRAGEPGGLDAVMIRTRQGEQMRLVLGEPGSCDGCVRVGDRIRARLSKTGSSGDGLAVRTMRVQRSGERIRFRNASGELLPVQARDRAQQGTNARARSRDRIHRPGAGNGGAGGGGSRGAGGNRGGRR